jgi:hypothetical protein
MVLHSRRLIFKERYIEYVHSHPSTDIIPSATDVYFMDDCESIVENTALDILVAAESFNDIFHRLPQIIEAWVANRRLDLLSLFPNSPSGNNGSPLDLATTYFSCSPTGCVASAQPIPYPRILVHKCTRELGIGYRNDSETLTEILASLGSELWNHRGQFTFFPEASRYARSIVESCGLDPEETTSSEMDEADTWVECISCSDNVPGRVVMNWRKAVCLLARAPFHLFPELCFIDRPRVFRTRRRSSGLSLLG